MNYKDLLTLFKIFFKIGLFTFGGGYSMIPFIEREVTQNHKFISSEEMLDILSISECTPGAISINCATFIGYKVCKFWGALISTISLILPSFLVILIISLFLNSFKESILITKFLKGIKIGVVILLALSAIKINSKTQKTKNHYKIILLVLGLLTFTNLTTVNILISSILIYFLLFKLKEKRR